MVQAYAVTTCAVFFLKVPAGEAVLTALDVRRDVGYGTACA